MKPHPLVNKNEIRYEKGYHDLKEIKKDLEDCIRTGINQIQMPKKQQSKMIRICWTQMNLSLAWIIAAKIL